MTDYSKMSDFEINRRVAMKAYGHAGAEPLLNIVICNGVRFDPCNKWSDAGPIISNNKISLHAPSITKTWMAEFTGSDDDVNDGFHVDYFESHHENPLRAAMIVFLMMKDAENVNPS